MTESIPSQFKENAVRQLADEDLRQALTKSKGHFTGGRQKSIDNLPEFDALRDKARDIKNHTIENLDFYLEAYEKKVLSTGGHVHWASTAKDAQEIVLNICQSVGATSVNKGKSMIGEECDINEALEAAGIKAVETDLGEYIIQIRN
ncbi:MAG: LUD domain-containing protein, partial [Alphaproteobacteria bacterium]|nr:LUD domain-containing protein [Alphaproteobacteria bacterium]